MDGWMDGWIDGCSATVGNKGEGRKVLRHDRKSTGFHVTSFRFSPRLLFQSSSLEILHCVVYLVCSNVSEERKASIFSD